jgi:NRAMP (natural resistance-associated macrophage protein)-like metal ion transporter
VPEPSPTRLRIGPGALVAAAFIGPGTVTTCTLAGIRSGTALLWALAFATLGTLVLQEMAARLGTITGLGLGDAVRRRIIAPAPRVLAITLIVVAIAGGNAAYQTGNLLGAALGLDVAFGGGARPWALLVAALAASLLASGRYRLIERVLVALVVIMAVIFLATAVAVRPDWPAVLRDLVRPSLPDGSALVALGLVGTTIVPYNLFLHASAAAERFTEGAAATRLRDARADLSVSILLGGVVSMAIVVAAAAAGARGATADSAGAMAAQLTPLLGRSATVVFAAGLFAAGMTSAITAPLAAAWAVAGALGWPRDLRDPRLRAVWAGVIATGALVAATGVQPVAAILAAQAANGLLLPVIAAFLLLVMNDRATLGTMANGLRSNLAGALVVAVTLVLGGRALLGVWTRLTAGQP